MSRQRQSQKGTFSVGIESFIKFQKNNYYSSAGYLESQTWFGFSAWAYINLRARIEIVGRFDTFDPNISSTSIKDGII